MSEQQPVEGRIHQINISNGGVPKLPVSSAVVTAEGIRGDFHDDINHGGPLAALCIFTLEQIQRLQAEGHPIRPGSAGENVTLSGIEQSALVPGARLVFGDQVEVELTRYTTPCKTISQAFADGDFTRISQKLHPSESRIYARVLRGGEMRAGQRVRLLP